MLKTVLLTIFCAYSLKSSSQPTYDQFVTRLKGGGSVIYNAFTFKMEEGFIRLDTQKITYTRKNVTKNQGDLILYYKDIKSVKKLRYIIIFPWKFVIKMKDGTQHYFMMAYRKKLIYIIRSHI
ncbi:MAG: hypothetical protein L3J06_01290 [Cyclobacteriaceae bacterium]|nr:hypothetical protein [Cyclobacteriaceae bacterium]